MTPTAQIIRKITDRLTRDHGYTFAKPTSRVTPQAAKACLAALKAPESASDFQVFIRKETDFGRFLENEARFKILIADLEGLAQAGAVPKFTPRKDGVLAQIVGVLSWGNMSPEEARLLSELRAQGTNVLRAAAGEPETRSPEDVQTHAHQATKAWADERGLMTGPRRPLDGLSAMSIEETLDLLLVSDPHDGLSDFQEFCVKAHKPGMQGVMRDSYEKDNRRDDYRKLVDLGVIPEISRPEETGGSFLKRMGRMLTAALVDVPAREDVPMLTEMGREVLRADLKRKALAFNLNRDVDLRV